MRLGECVASALAGAAEQGSWIAAEAALKPLDPLVRVAARRRLRSALERARRRTTLDEPGHVLRVAALLAHGPEPAELDLDDPERVASVLSARGLGSVPKQKPWWTLALLSTIAAGVLLVFLFARLTAPFDPRATPAGRVLGEGLTAFVSAFSGSLPAKAKLADARAKATGWTARRAFGEDGAKHLERVLDTGKRAAEARGEGSLEAKNAFIAAVEDFSRYLQQTGQPFYVDADVFTSLTRVQPALLSSYVEREIELETEGKRVRALHLWRLDRIGLGGVLGYTRPRTPEALVLLDPIETDLVRWVLPALPEGERVELFDDETALQEWAHVAQLEAAAVVRRHYAPLLAPDIARVGRILARRRTLVEKWRRSLDGQGVVFLVPDRLIPEADYARDLEIRITRPNLREWDELHAELLSPAVLAAFAKLRDRYTLSIERHEAQHRLDFARDFVPLPPLAARLGGIDDPLDLAEGGFAATLRNELSAYLAQLAQGPDSPQLDLILMIRLALNRGTAGGAHARAATTALVAVAAELGFDTESELARGLGRRQVVDLFFRVAEKPPAAIRDAATRAYATSFGVSLPTLRRREIRRGTPWRH